MATVVGTAGGNTHTGVDTENDSIWGAGGGDILYGGAVTGGGNDLLDGGTGSDVIYGGDGEDTLIGGSGNGDDTLYGGAGTDTADYSRNLTALGPGSSTFATNATAVNVNLATGTATGLGTDSLFSIENVIGGSGADTITGSDAANVLDGGLGNDSISGGVGADTLIGGDGVDTLLGGVDNDVLFGGAGVDRLDGGSGSDTLTGGDGADVLIGGVGSDTADYTGSNGAVNVNINDAVAESGGHAAGDALTGIENITGSDFNDTLTGNNSANELFGGGGADAITGNLGSDSIDGGAGNDTINAGPDTIGGGAPAPTNEFLDWTTGGGDGSTIASSFTQDTGTMNVTVNYVPGVGNQFTVETGAIYSPEALISDNSGATLGRPGAGELTELSLNFAAESGSGMTNEVSNVLFRISDIDTGNFIDNVTILAYDELGNLVPVTITTTSTEISIVGNTATAFGNNTTQSQADGSILISIPGPVSQIVIQYNDLDNSDQIVVVSDVHFTTIPATADTSDADTVSGGLGDDVIETGIGADLVYGDEGNDSLLGEAGVDTLYGGIGADTLLGGDNGDLEYGGSDQDTLYGDAGNDTLYGDDGNDRVFGGADNDTVFGGIGLDTLYGDANDDRVFGGDNSDLAYGGVGLDTLYGDAGTDTLYGGDNGDLAYGGTENDTIYGDLGNDTLFGDANDDRVFGGDNSDLAYGGVGLDTLYGDAGTDTLYGGDNGDLAYGGTESDTIYGEAGADTLFGDAGTDTLYGGDNADLAYGGTESDLLYGGADQDTLYGDAGNDTLFGEVGNDRLYGGDNSDILYGGVGLDTLFGDAGNDTLLGEAGNDVLTGGAGTDSVFGGDDRDQIFVNYTKPTSETIVGNAVLNDALGNESVDGGSGPGTTSDNDTLTVDITGMGWARIDLVYDPLNAENGTITFFNSTGGIVGTLTFTDIENLVIVCFTPGTQILTDRGAVAVEALAPGDLVVTRDNGLQPLRWVGTRTLSYAELLARPELQPVRIAAGALAGVGPERTMLVSPQHRVLIEGARAEMFFGETEVLVPAKHLTGLAEVTRALPAEGVTYVHILFDQHEIVESDGIWTESFQPAERTLSALDEAARAEVLAIFPELATDTTVFPAARLSLKAHEAKVLVSG